MDYSFTATFPMFFCAFRQTAFYSFRATTRFANSEQRRTSRLEFLLEERERSGQVSKR